MQRDKRANVGKGKRQKKRISPLKVSLSYNRCRPPRANMFRDSQIALSSEKDSAKRSEDGKARRNLYYSSI